MDLLPSSFEAVSAVSLEGAACGILVNLVDAGGTTLPLSPIAGRNLSAVDLTCASMAAPARAIRLVVSAIYAAT